MKFEDDSGPQPLECPRGLEYKISCAHYGSVREKNPLSEEFYVNEYTNYAQQGT